MNKSIQTIAAIGKYCVQQGVSVDDRLIPMEMDLNDLNSVKEFVQCFKSKFKHLNILINNAGVMSLKTREVTVQKLEKTMGVNHISHFLLTLLLTNELKYG